MFSGLPNVYPLGRFLLELAALIHPILGRNANHAVMAVWPFWIRNHDYRLRRQNMETGNAGEVNENQ